MKKIVVWFLGSNATGKTTQAALIHKKLRSAHYSTNFVAGGNELGAAWVYTQCGEYTANLGKFTHPVLIAGEKGNKMKPTDCCGTDTMAKKAQIIGSFEDALKSYSRIIIVEGIMATGTWIDFLKTPNTIVFIVHLKIALEDNILRLRARRAAKKKIAPELVEFLPKTVGNITGKIKGFESLYKRMKPKVGFAMEIDAMEDINVINKKILQKLSKIMDKL